MISTDAQYDKAAKKAKAMVKKVKINTRMQFDTEKMILGKLYLYFDGIDKEAGCCIVMVGNKVVDTWMY